MRASSLVPIQMPKSQPLKLLHRLGDVGGLVVPIQMPKSQPLKHVIAAALAGKIKYQFRCQRANH